LSRRSTLFPYTTLFRSEDNGKVVHAPDNLNSLQSVRAKMILENKGIFEWDVIIEKDCSSAWVGVCSSENFNYETFAGYQLTGWRSEEHTSELQSLRHLV